jgi:hypothetical protein
MRREVEFLASRRTGVPFYSAHTCVKLLARYSAAMRETFDSHFQDENVAPHVSIAIQLLRGFWSRQIGADSRLTSTKSPEFWTNQRAKSPADRRGSSLQTYRRLAVCRAAAGRAVGGRGGSASVRSPGAAHVGVRAGGAGAIALWMRVGCSSWALCAGRGAAKRAARRTAS